MINSVNRQTMKNKQGKQLQWNSVNSTSDNSTSDNSTSDNSTLDHSTSDNSTLDHSTSDNSTLDHSTSANSTSDNSKPCLTHTKLHGLCLGNDNLLGISQTFGHNLNWSTALVPSNYLVCGWMCSHSYVTGLISLFSFSHEKKISANFRKFSQEM